MCALSIAPGTAMHSNKAAVLRMSSCIRGTDASLWLWTGNCTADLEQHCKGVAAGKAGLASCITYHVKNEKSGNDANGKSVPLAQSCIHLPMARHLYTLLFERPCRSGCWPVLISALRLWRHRG